MQLLIGVFMLGFLGYGIFQNRDLPIHIGLRLCAKLMYLDIEFLASLAGTSENGLPIGGGRIFDNDRNDRFLVRGRDLFNDAGNSGYGQQSNKVTPI